MLSSFQENRPFAQSRVNIARWLFLDNVQVLFFTGMQTFVCAFLHLWIPGGKNIINLGLVGGGLAGFIGKAGF